MDMDKAKLDEALNNMYTLPDFTYFSTHKDISTKNDYYVLLEDENGDNLSMDKIYRILDMLNSDIIEKKGIFYNISKENADKLIASINYIPLKLINKRALCSLANIINNNYTNKFSLYQAHSTKGKLYVPCDESNTAETIIQLESQYNLKYFGTTSSGWKAISYLIFIAKDPESLYTLLRIEGKLKSTF